MGQVPAVSTIVLLSALAIGPAVAADFPPVAPAAPFVAAPAFSWTGFYVGVHAGLAWSDDGEQASVCADGAADAVIGDPQGDGSFFSTGDLVRQCEIGADEGPPGIDFLVFNDETVGSADEDSSFGIGGQVGFNWQTGRFVFGIEADATLTTGDDDEGVDLLFEVWGDPVAGAPLVLDDFDGQGTATFRTETDWLSTLRGRAGVALGERLLVYGTGGLAFTSVETSFEGSFFDEETPQTISFDESSDDSAIGFALGLGAEGMITRNLTARIEYMYVGFDEEDADFDVVLTGDTGERTVTFGNTYDLDQHIVRAGLNWKFSSF